MYSSSLPHLLSSSPLPLRHAGKSTALMILAGKLKPNLGKFDHPPDWQDILVNFRGSELQNFFTKLLEDNIKAIIKPQYVDSIPRSVKGKVLEIILRKDERKVHEDVNEQLELNQVLDRDIVNLSGGELQRFAIAVTSATHTQITTAPGELSCPVPRSPPRSVSSLLVRCTVEQCDPGGSDLYVRRAVVVPGCAAKAEGCAGHPRPVRRGQVRHRRGARPVRAGLP